MMIQWSMIRRAKLKIMILILGLLTGIATAQTPSTLKTFSGYDATVATEWFRLSLELVQETKGYTPPVASRAFAYRGVTLYEAMVPSTQGYQSLAGQLNGLSALPRPEEGQAYHGLIVANSALAVADAFVASWEAKYQYNVLRPITYVQQVISADWQPLLNTPAFPEYPSGHSVQSAAAAEVLSNVFGETISFTDHTHDSYGLQARSFASFEQAAQEAALSRLYGDIHFRAAIENGLDQGRCIGGNVLSLEFHR
jgi:PAP2 superfamily